jgi:hypothetical protein
MPRMLELIRASAVPANLMQSAAKGALSIPAPEMIEILVHLATQNKVFGEQATLTLAGWDESSSLAVASNPTTSKEVLDYLIDPHNLRPALLPALLENPAVTDATLMALAGSISRDAVDTFLKSKRINSSREIMQALAANRNFTGIQSAMIEEWLADLIASSTPSTKPPVEIEKTPEEKPLEEKSPEIPEAENEPDVPEEEITKYLTEHAVEIAAEAGKPFQPMGGSYDESVSTDTPPVEAKSEPAAAPEKAPESEFKRPALKKSVLTADEKRGSALQKIAKLDITGRIQLAMKGTKEERALLVRDGTKIVALAVLESPKVGDSEIEKFAGQKNVLESVLRAIPMKRRFMKQYGVVRNLVSNPRTPIDVSLGLVKHLMLNDLKHLSGNKEISDTIRKIATKMYRQKLDTSKKSTD